MISFTAFTTPVKTSPPLWIFSGFTDYESCVKLFDHCTIILPYHTRKALSDKTSLHDAEGNNIVAIRIPFLAPTVSPFKQKQFMLTDFTTQQQSESLRVFLPPARFISHNKGESEEVRQKMKNYWQVYRPSLESMMLSNEAVYLHENDQNEIFSYLPSYQGKRVLELGAGIGWVTLRE